MYSSRNKQRINALVAHTATVTHTFIEMGRAANVAVHQMNRFARTLLAARRSYVARRGMEGASREQAEREWFEGEIK
jgi:hypothetical protein